MLRLTFSIFKLNCGTSKTCSTVTSGGRLFSQYQSWPTWSLFWLWQPCIGVKTFRLIIKTLLPFYSRTINPDLSISVFVCSFKKCFCLVISQISTLLGKSFQNIPVGGSTEESQSHTPQRIFRICIASISLSLFWVVWSSSYLSSSSSIKPLPSTSKTRKTFLTSSADMAVIPTRSKNFLGSNVSAARREHVELTVFSGLVVRVHAVLWGTAWTENQFLVFSWPVKFLCQCVISFV